MVLTFARGDIRRAVSPNAYEAGRQYQRAGRVSDLRLEAGGRRVQAKVEGHARRPYQLDIDLEPRRGQIVVNGACSCPVGGNCKHVAAALLELLDCAPPAAAIAPCDVLAAAPSGLPPDLQAWLRALDKAREDADENYPPTVRKRLIYVGRPVGAPNRPDRLGLDLVGIELTRDGGSDRVTRHDVWQLLGGTPPRFVRPSDRGILRRLSAAANDSSQILSLVRLVVATGRGRWGAHDGPALNEGAPRPGRLAWRMGENGAQRLTLETDGALALLADPPLYVVPETGEIGPLDVVSDLQPAPPFALLSALLDAPAVAPEFARRLGAELVKRAGLTVPAPRAVAFSGEIGGPPKPCLEFFAVDPPGYDPVAAWLSPRRRLAGPWPLARLAFRYDDALIAADEPSAVVTRRRGDDLVRITRDASAEAAAAQVLAGLGLRPVAAIPSVSGRPLDLDEGDASWIDLLVLDVPRLRAEGWDVTIDPDFPFRITEPDGDFDGELRQPSGTDWFEFHLGATIDGERVDLVPPLLDMIRSGEAARLAREQATDDDLPLLLPLPDGRLLSLAAARLRPILQTLLALHAGNPDDGKLVLRHHDAALLAELDAASAAAGLAWRDGESLRELGRLLREHGAMPTVPVPNGFRATLRPYQQRGVDWLGLLGAARLGGVLADDMGLGKTVQALAHLCVEQAAGRLDRPSLVVCPTSVVPNWSAEAARFAPDLRTLVLHGPDRKRRFDGIASHDLVITTYPLLFRDGQVLTAHDWSVVLLDEAHGIKNPAATVAALARRLRARQRIALTGTPLENHLGELWSLFDWVLPGLLGSRQSFARSWRKPIEQSGDVARRDMLAARVRPFLLRRAKAEVATELPPCTEIGQPVELGADQRAIYEGVRLAMHAKVSRAIAERGLSCAGIVVLDALLKLRQACCDPRLVRSAPAGRNAGSAKLERLMELLPVLLEDGRRVLLFSQFTSMLALIAQRLDAAGIAHLVLTGSTRDREGPVRRFQSGELPLFLISLKAGGVGLNLTAADTVIHYDPWWNPAVENQATDRAHRIGQDKPVFVHRLVALGTVEERMEELKARKRALAAGILDAAAGDATTLTETDIDALLAPVG